MKKRLTLNKETLRTLNTRELQQANGGLITTIVTIFIVLDAMVSPPTYTQDCPLTSDTTCGG